tara:strand:+ start:307 stop:942 length:636 start_codon:yes stop_codon:yes gene_type:complete
MGTNIDELIEDISNNKLSNEENSMVDSIINDLNGSGSRRMNPGQQQPRQIQQQQQQRGINTTVVDGSGYPPQLTPEEKQMLLKQQQMQQQVMYEQQMQQQKLQQMQQQQQQQQQMQQQQMQQQQPPPQEKPKVEGDDIKSKIQNILLQIKTSLVVFLLVVFFNLNPIDEFMRFKQLSIFYNSTDEQSTFLYAFVKAIFISLLYYFITYLIQ